MIILGIDPGLATIGYGIIKKDNSRVSCVDYGVITTSPHESTAVRLALIDKHVTELIVKHNPDEVAIEELFFNTNITTGIKVAQARGVIIVCAVKECGLIFEYTPLQVKMAVTGSGRADKKQVQYMVKTILGLATIPKPDDAADALAIALCHSNTIRYANRQMK